MKLNGGGRGRAIKDPTVVHLKRTLKSLNDGIADYFVAWNEHLSTGLRSSTELRDRRDELDAAIRKFMDDVQQHVRYVEDPDDPVVRSCEGLFANAKGHLKRLRKNALDAQTSGVSSEQDVLREQYRRAAELDRQTREDTSSVRTVSGGLPGLGKRR